MDCPYVPELGYGDFSKRLVGRLAGRRYPISGSVEMTFRCNLHCQHCYVKCGNNPDVIQEELSTQEWYSVFDQIADAGTLWLLLTGGEPLTRPDFLDLYTYVKQKGFIFTLFTNGTLLTPKIADHLAEWLPFAVEITLYGGTQKTYELITGVPGSHTRCMRGIELLMERNIPLRLKTMLMTLNKHELWDIKAYAESLDVPFRFDAMINAGIGGQSDPTRLRLKPKEIVAYEQAHEERWATWLDFVKRYQDVRPASDRLYVCGAGYSSFHVDPYGQMSPCMSIRTETYDLRTGTFSTGWDQFLPAIRQQPAPETYVCADCELRAFCEQCPGWSRMEHNGELKPVEFLCQVTQERIRAATAGLQAQQQGEEIAAIPVT